MKKSLIEVIEVKEPPAIGKPEMMSGIRSKEAAANWATRRGYAKVYWFKSRERVYADKRSISQAIPLLITNEVGGGLLGDILLAALVIVVTLLLGDCGVPW